MQTLGRVCAGVGAVCRIPSARIGGHAALQRVGMTTFGRLPAMSTWASGMVARRLPSSAARPGVRLFSRTSVRQSAGKGKTQTKPGAEPEPELGPEGLPKFEPDTPASRRIFRLCIGGVVAFVCYFGYNTYFGYYSETAKRAAVDAVQSIPLYKGNPVVYLDLSVNGQGMGRVVIQLRKDVCPMAAENFRQLCTGECGFGYAGNRVHAIIPGQYLASGDFQYGTGEGGSSIYGEPFPDEKSELRHVGPGVVSMFSQVPDENGSQFYIALGKAPIHDGRYVVIGNVMAGLEVVQTMEQFGSWRGDVGADIRIDSCGELRLPEHLVEQAEEAAAASDKATP